MISKTYLSLCKEGSQIIIDNTQLTIFGGFAPNSRTAEDLSKALGQQTVSSGSITKNKDSNSQSLMMMARPLLTPDELKSLPRGKFIVMKTGTHPIKTEFQLFLKWGIRFGEPYQVEESPPREVKYADRVEVEREVLKRYPPQIRTQEPPRSYSAAPMGHTRKPSASEIYDADVEMTVKTEW